MGWRAALAADFPSILKHEGLWRGTYRHYDGAGALTDTHDSAIRCEFPDDGPYAYIQHNHWRWADGREARMRFGGVLKDGKLWWDEPSFSGCAWETDSDLILLDLERKDIPGARMFELIMLAPGGATRARTWHFFKDGALIRRTCCDEHLEDQAR